MGCFVHSESKALGCSVCQKECNKFIAHPKNGNPESKRKDNLIPLCSKCHNAILKGLNKNKYYPEESWIVSKLVDHRTLWLIKFKKYSLKKAKEIIEFEKLGCFRGGAIHLSKNNCFDCGRKENIVSVVNKLIVKYGDEKMIRTRSISICVDCVKKLNIGSKDSWFTILN